MSKPKATRTFVVCVKSQRNYNLKNFSLYRDTLTLDNVVDICRLMLIEERDKYLDLEKRYIFDDTKVKSHTHTIQILKFNDNKAVSSKSFGVKEVAYSANEIANCLEMWFKKDLRESKKLDFPRGKVYDLIKECLK